LEAVFRNQSLPKLGSPLVNATCDLDINGAAGKEGLRYSVHIVNGGGNRVDAHTTIVQQIDGFVN
jgi:hypothetical protein